MSGGAAAADRTEPVLRISNLRVAFGPGTPVVDGVSLSIAPGECLALVGESGSGKSVTARTVLGLAGERATVTADALELRGRSLLGLSDRAWRGIRGREVGLILQDALASLDPLRPVGREIADALRLHTPLPPRQRGQRVLDLLRSVGMPEPELRARQRSGELSGGLRQRALIASAIALDPPLLIADEPTTALDTTVQARILDLLGELRAAGTAILLISHDLAVVRGVADRVAVMADGRIVETGSVTDVLERPREEYTRRLVRAVPAGKPRGQRLSVGARPSEAPGAPVAVSHRQHRVEAKASAPLLTGSGLTRSFRGLDGSRRIAVQDASFELRAGETLGLVGESGSGKTTLARLALGLLEPDTGTVELDVQPWSPLPERERRTRRSIVGAVYQDPLASFDPRLSVGRILADALSGGRHDRPARIADDLASLLASVGLPPSVLARRPLHLSGGQRQRVAIARALAPRPRVLICDEPVSALDVSVQAQVLDLLDALQERLGLAYLFISHDLGVIGHVSDRVAVMSEGRIVETGPTADVLAAPEHPFTRALLAAAPTLGASGRNGS
ncbi:dipeptide ABC transporter ATP-binding protein [Microbacteriaceae bacterium 4G12]